MADGETERLTVLREHLHRFLEGLLPGRVHLNGHPTRRLPNALHVSIEGTRALDGLSDSTDLPPPLAPPAMPGRTRRPPSGRHGRRWPGRRSHSALPRPLTDSEDIEIARAMSAAANYR